MSVFLLTTAAQASFIGQAPPDDSFQSACRAVLDRRGVPLLGEKLLRGKYLQKIKKDLLMERKNFGLYIMVI